MGVVETTALFIMSTLIMFIVGFDIVFVNAKSLIILHQGWRRFDC